MKFIQQASETQSLKLCANPAFKRQGETWLGKCFPSHSISFAAICMSWSEAYEISKIARNLLIAITAW